MTNPSTMIENHPITPPPELVQRWTNNAHLSQPNMGGICHEVATQAARWGDEQRLEACIAWLHYNYPPVNCEALRAAMHPKPPSLAEQALEALKAQIDRSFKITPEAQERADLIRAALERLKELEDGNE